MGKYRPKPDHGILCNPKVARNIALLEDWLLGLSRKEIAEKYDVTGSRVNQLVRNCARTEHLPKSLRAKVLARREAQRVSHGR